jgi:uncharacterized protein (TIGR02391 family)
METNIGELRELYGVLVGVREAFAESNQLFNKPLGDMYSTTVQDLAKVLHTDLSRYELPKDVYKEYSGREARKPFLACRLFPLMSSLEFKYHLNEEIVERGSLYGSLEDEGLRKRCADILLGKDSFDRAVNQATEVLEERIRRKANDDSDSTGTQLVNEYVKANPDGSKLIFSRDANEQDGFSQVLRGVMLAFRNTTHHSPSDTWTREDAYKVCAFVDYLLKRLEGARVRN